MKKREEKFKTVLTIGTNNQVVGLKLKHSHIERQDLTLATKTFYTLPCKEVNKQNIVSERIYDN